MWKWVWARCLDPNTLGSCIITWAHERWKWVRVCCQDPNTLGLTMTTQGHKGWKWVWGVLRKPKHVGLGCDSMSPWEVKVGLDALLGSKHAELRCIRGKKWVQTRSLDPSMLGSGRTLESGHMRLGRRSPSPWWCQVYHAHTRCTPCMGSGFLLKLMLSRELGSSDHTRAHFPWAPVVLWARDT
jgi:hypothetical protein